MQGSVNRGGSLELPDPQVNKDPFIERLDKVKKDLRAKYKAVMEEYKHLQLGASSDANQVSTSTALFNAIRYERVIRAVSSKLGAPSGSEAQRGDSTPIHKVLKAQYHRFVRYATSLTSKLTTMLGTSHPSKPVRYIRICYMCHHQNEVYCEDCQNRFNQKYGVLLIKKSGNQMLRMHNHELRERLNGASTEDEERAARKKKLADICAKKLRIEQLKQKLEQLKKQNEVCRQTNAEIQEKIIFQRKRNLALALAIQDRRQNYHDLLEKLAVTTARRNAMIDELARARVEKISQLLSIMPLNPHDKKPNYVLFMNETLPDNVKGYMRANDPERQIIVAAALGNLVRFIKIIASILDCHLPLHMEFAGSMSSIAADDSTRHHILSELVNQKEFPLAVEQLAQNINYLCSSQGLIISTSPDKPFLKDLRTLLGLGHEKLGRELPKVANTPLSQQNQQKQLVTFRPATATVATNPAVLTFGDDDDLSDFVQIDITPLDPYH